MPFLTTRWDVPDDPRPAGDGLVDIPTGGLVLDLDISVQMSMRTPPAATHTRWTIPGDQIRAAGYTPAQLAAAVHVDYAPTPVGYATRHWTTTADGSLVLDFPTYQWVPDSTPSESLHVAVDWGLPAGIVTGVFETLGDDGKPYAEVDQPLHFTADVVPAAHRTALYGRDRSGVLWQHQATSIASRPGTFNPRTRVGGGWGVYNTITALGPLKANGTGDLVARDSSGVLWYHSRHRLQAHTRSPSAPVSAAAGTSTTRSSGRRRHRRRPPRPGRPRRRRRAVALPRHRQPPPPRSPPAPASAPAGRATTNSSPPATSPATATPTSSPATPQASSGTTPAPAKPPPPTPTASASAAAGRATPASSASAT